jgi:1-acyl-sn-glycerol-3-phosphate acyltransferase
MNALALPSLTWPHGAGTFSLRRLLAQATRASLRTAVLLFLYPFILADAAWLRLVTPSTGTALAHARANWLHRWCRILRSVLGLRPERRGFAPTSGILVTNYASLLDVILLAAIRPCVFVAGDEMRRWPIVGRLARLGGTIFIDRRRHHDVARVNFMIQRAVQRRLLVVMFPECSRSKNATVRPCSASLFQAAVELGCTLTAAAIEHHPEASRTPLVISSQEGTSFFTLLRFIVRARTRAVVTFSPPTFRCGDRKHLAHQLRGEIRKLHSSSPAP